MDVTAQSNLKEITDHVEGIFRVIDRYESSRPGALGFTKLEEAILWLQVMVQQIQLKNNKPEELGEKKDTTLNND